jgi:hypothetical protein
VSISLARIEEIIDASGVAPRIEALLPIGVRHRQLRVRNQRILTAWNARQADNARRAAAGRPPKTRRRRRKTLTDLATAGLPP